MKKYVVRTVAIVLIVIGVAFVLLTLSAWQAGLSIPAQLLRVVLLPAIPMESTSDPEVLAAMVRENRTTGPALPSEAFRAKFNVQEEDFNGERLWTVAPHESTTNLHILYLPGGAYVNEVLSLHWDIVEQLVERTDATLVMPFYPLAPEHDWQPAFALVNAVYERMVEAVGAENVVVMGDSAGGGIALSVVQQIRDEKRTLPAAVVLFAPWPDLTFSDPSQIELKQHDLILSMDSLLIGGEWWAGDLLTSDPRVSPLFGSAKGLPPIGVFTGTEDLLYPDATRFAINAEEAGVPVTLFEYKNQFHVWMGVFPSIIPEASRALDEAAAFILEHTDTPPSS